MENSLQKLQELVQNEIDMTVQKGRIEVSAWDPLKDATEILVNLDMLSTKGVNNEYSMNNRYNYENSRNYNYNDNSYARGRNSRYSRHDEKEYMREMLLKAAERANSEHDRETIYQCIDKLEMN